MKNNRITKLCGIRYPIISGPMLYISNYRLVAAVSKSGGLGCLAATGMSRDDFFREVANVRAITNNPFAVNIAWIAPNSRNLLDWCIESNIKIIVSSAGIDQRGLAKIQNEGVKILQVVSKVTQAKKCQEIGLDAVICKSIESGGVNAVNAQGGLTLIPQVVDAVKMPVIAAGGIGDGRAFAAVRCLGAEGAMIGTRFLMSQECSIRNNLKQALLEANGEDTLLISGQSHMVRVLKNCCSIELCAKGEDVSSIWSKSMDYQTEGDPGSVLIGAGQVAGLISNIQKSENILNEINRVYKSTIENMFNSI